MLQKKEDYWYGDSPSDIWSYFVIRTRDSGEPVKHWKQAVCQCGHQVFQVDYDAEEHFLVRYCMHCDAEKVTEKSR